MFDVEGKSELNNIESENDLHKVSKNEKNKIREKEKQDEKKRRKRILLLLLLLLLLLFIFGLTAKYGSNIIENIQNLLGNKVPSAPVIDGGSEEWARERLIKVVKDSELEEGLAYYEYCISEKKDTKNCKWVRTDTKNMKAIDTGIYYITFRGIDNAGKKSKNSNYEIVYIDNVNPVIKEVKIKEKTTTSITVNVTATDTHSGVAKYEYSLDGKTYVSGSKNYTFTGLEKNTGYLIYIRVTDKVGNYTVLSMQVTTPLTDKDDSCELNCDTDDDGKCDYNCDTDGDGECDLNCDDNNDGECDRNCDDDGDGECDTNCEEPNKPGEDDKDDEDDKCEVNCDDDGDGECDRNCDEEPTKPEKPGEDDKDDDKDEEEWDIPIIHLNDVPIEFPYGSYYELPSYVSFGNDTGTYSCTVKGKEYTDTSTLPVGKHVIICTATSSHNISVSVAKEVEVVMGTVSDEEWDGWILLTLYYPANSTDWE